MNLIALVLLQVDSLPFRLNDVFSTDNLSTIELYLVSGIIFIQLYLSFKIRLKIKKFSNIFYRQLTIINSYVDKIDFKNNRDNLEAYLNLNDSGQPVELIADKSVIVLPYIESVKRDNEITQRIITVLNSYLINNFGAIVNFSIIKDIFEREVDLEDSEITNAISTPLYLGLAATMLGVIFGLFGMPNFSDTETSLLSGVAPLINGVKLAMFASLTGLLCTTFLSSFIYKNARSKVNREMNAQISYFQNKLLPVLIKAEDTGVSGLKSSLDKFARETSKILEDLHGAVDKTSRTLSTQLEVISKVENLDFTKVSRINLELFDRLESNMNALNSFSQYLNLMASISGNLSSFSERTNDFKKIADSVNSNLGESKQLMQFLTAHLQAIQSSGSNALNAFNLVDSKFTDAIEKLSDEVDKRIQVLNEKSSVLDSNLMDTFSKVGEEIQKVSSTHMQELSQSYADSMPEFKNLEQLQSLPALKENLDKQLMALDLLNSNINILIKKTNENHRKDKEVRPSNIPVDEELDPTPPVTDDPMKSWYKFWS